VSPRPLPRRQARRDRTAGIPTRDCADSPDDCANGQRGRHGWQGAARTERGLCLGSDQERLQHRTAHRDQPRPGRRPPLASRPSSRHSSSGTL